MLLHEVDVQKGLCQTLGMLLDTENFQTMNTWKRFGLIKNSIPAVVGQRVVCGWTLEVLLGPCTYFALVRRDLLSVFNVCYAFIRKCYLSAEPLWKTVREELRCFRGLMP